jgi:hypothetical protein
MLSTLPQMVKKEINSTTTSKDFINTYRVNQRVHLLCHLGHYKAILYDTIAKSLPYLNLFSFVPLAQFGSWPGKQFISAVLHKILTYEIVCHIKETAAFIENDAVSYYDWIVNNLLLLSLSIWECNILQHRPWLMHCHILFTS